MGGIVGWLWLFYQANHAVAGEPGARPCRGGAQQRSKRAGNLDKREAWETLRKQAMERFGPELVFGEGPLDARLAMVGEAPGGQETKARRPFVGRAGQLLDELLETAGLDRSNVYVTNTVKIRPTAEKSGRLKNRPPRTSEIREGLEVLLPELRLVAPSVLILLGNVPARTLIDRSFTMRSHRGMPFESILGIPAIATYHPAYLLRLRGPDLDQTKEIVVSDLVAARSGRPGGEGGRGTASAPRR